MFQESYDLNREKITLAAKLSLALFAMLPEEAHQNKCGGYMSLLPTNDVMQWTERFGFVPPNQKDDTFRTKAVKYRLYSIEKANRLDGDLCRMDDHVSSFQSRSPEDGRYGGAVRFPNNIILSFSGLPELGDEAIVLLTGLLLGWLTKNEARAIARISKNEIFTDLLAEATNRGIL